MILHNETLIFAKAEKRKGKEGRNKWVGLINSGGIVLFPLTLLTTANISSPSRSTNVELCYINNMSDLGFSTIS